ncbi:hypothetical protein [Actinoplanes auranticolor]|uniref:Uncharacterized protein n=1 Tax=Actinoplanes auranticolor TaxID=47988 RepID=A0A919S683_9ACTN|nr:hypothetical protein [Actinoplanes auranticolor]GIM65108.1 hypothetical protein Aau02nite_14790 [Actinoplanes auranticolor]
MLIYYAVGRLGVQQAREAAHSALPDAPVIPDQPPRVGAFRVRTAGALHRLADRIGPACHAPLQQA